MTRSSAGYRGLRVALALLALVLFSGICTLMLEYRIAYTSSTRYDFLSWNLMLAWIPLGAALIAAGLLCSRWGALRLLGLPVAAAWLLFLPNAPYLATDLIHLSASSTMPLWFDAAMLAAYAGLGVMLGLTSLLLMQYAVALHAGRAGGWLFAGVTLLLTGFGVYLGRFERFNSWEALSEPSLVLQEAWLHLRDPFGYSRAFEFTILASLLLILAYLAFVAVAAGSTRLLSRLVRR